MTTYSAAIAVTNSELRVTRPLPAPQAVDDVVDSLLYTVRDGGTSITSIALQIEADDTPAEQPPADPAAHAADPTPKAVTDPLSS